MSFITDKPYLKYLVWALLLASAIALIITQMLAHPFFKLSNHANIEKQKSLADSYINKASIVSFVAGIPQLYFKSEQIIHYPKEKESTALQPRIKAFRKNNQAWFMQAKHAWLNDDNTLIRMEDDVIVKQRNATLETPILWIWPEKEFVKTDQFIKITSAQNITTAIGMSANLQSSHYQLLNNVRVTIKPKNKN